MRAPLVALVVAATAIGPAAGTSAASWSGVEPLPADASSTPFDSDTNARGDSIAVYEVASSYSTKVRVVAGYRRAGRAWQTHTLGETFSGAGGDSAAASIDGQGRAAVAWIDGTVTPQVIRLDTFNPAAGAWNPVGSYADPNGEVRLASAPGGRTLLVFNSSGATMKGQVASSPLALSPSAPTHTISTPGTTLAGFPRAAAGSDGTVAAIWAESDGTHMKVVGAENSPGAPGHGNGNFSRPAVASNPGVDSFPGGLAVLGNGTLVAAFGQGSAVAWSTRPRPNGSNPDPFWSSPQTLQAGCSPPGAVAADVDARNVVTAAYDCPGTPHRRIRVAARNPGASFGAPRTVVSASTDAVGPHLDVAPDGSAVLAWTQQTSPTPAAGAAVRAPGAAPTAFGQFRTIANRSPLDAGIAQGGDAMLLLSSFLVPRVAAVVYFDRHRPALSIRAAHLAFARRPLHLRAVVGESFSHVASIRWSFGDGTQGAGADVDHSFRRRGTYVVKVTATDSGGNTATATWKVRVYRPDTARPRLRITARTARVVNGRARIPVRCANERFGCEGKVTLTRKGKRVGRKAFHAPGRRRLFVRVKLSKRARKALSGKGTLKVKATARGEDAAGNAGRVRRTVTLRG